MSLAIELIEKIAADKTAWLKDYDNADKIEAFKEQYSNFRTAKSTAQRERLTVSVINTNSGQKRKNGI